NRSVVHAPDNEALVLFDANSVVSKGKIILEYERPVEAAGVLVVEKGNLKGTITGLDAIDDRGGYVQLWKGTAPDPTAKPALARYQDEEERIYHFTFAEPQRIERLAVHVDVSAYRKSEREQLGIDAVGLVLPRGRPVASRLETRVFPDPLPPRVVWSNVPATPDCYFGKQVCSTARVVPRIASHGARDFVFPAPVRGQGLVFVEVERVGRVRRIEDRSSSPPVVLWEGRTPVVGERQFHKLLFAESRVMRRLRFIMDAGGVVERDEEPALQLDAVGILPANPIPLSKNVLTLRPAPMPLREGTIWATSATGTEATVGLALGPPRAYPAGGEPPDGGFDHCASKNDADLTFRFPERILAERLVVVETQRPGSIVAVQDVSSPDITTLWKGIYGALAPAQHFELRFDPPRSLQAVRLRLRGRNERYAIDAVGIEPVGAPPDGVRTFATVKVVPSPQPLPPRVQWARAVLDATSWGGIESHFKDRARPDERYAHRLRPPLSDRTLPFAPREALGPPDVYPQASKRFTWEPLRSNGEAYITLGWGKPVWTDEIVIVEPKGSPSVARVEDLSFGASNVVWRGAWGESPGHQFRLRLPYPRWIERLRIVVRAKEADIDAVGLIPSRAPSSPPPPPVGRPARLVIHPAPTPLPKGVEWGGLRQNPFFGEPALWEETRRAYRGQRSWRQKDGTSSSLVHPRKLDELEPSSGVWVGSGRYDVLAVAFEATRAFDRLAWVEMLGAGSVSRVEVKRPEGRWRTVWRGTYPHRADQQWVELQLERPTVIAGARLTLEGWRAPWPAAIAGVGAWASE
ncbi:MAG: hypothetical protein AAGA56_21650, partial [Myxococcota bacterium]